MLDKKDTTLIKLDCKSKDKVYDMLFGKADACLKNAKTVALLYLGSPYYMTRALEEYNIEEVNIFTTKDFKFIYEPFENAERVKIWYVDNVKDTFKECDMKFDCIIMNPPYQRNLHLKILAESIKHLKDDKSVCVNLSPVLWLEDPHAHMKSKSNLFKFDNSIVHKCEQLDVIDKDIANQLFNTGLFANLGIYVCKKNAKGIDSKNFWKRNFEDWEVKVFDKVYALKTHIEDKCENNKRDGIRVPIAFIAGNRGTLPIYKDIAYVVDGMKDGKDWTKCKNNGGYEKEEGIPIPISIKFATEVEAQNFYDSWKTTFCKWLSKLFLFDQNIPLRFLPFLGDVINPRTGLKGYKGKWTNEDLYKFFNITPEEQKVIEETMEKYK